MPAETKNNSISLSQLVEGNPVATIIIDAQHRVTHWNRACAVLTGVAASDMIGRNEQWRAFYNEARPIMADLIVDQAGETAIANFYSGKCRPSELIDGAWEAEDFFPAFGKAGCWLFFTAAPLHNADGELVGAIETLQDITQRRLAEEALRRSEERYRQLSQTDALTGLFNSRHLQERLVEELARARRYGRPLSILVADCDDFKAINDRFGHLEGDKVLQSLAGVISTCLRLTDAAFRYGGEEFVLILPEADTRAAMTLAERLCGCFAESPVKTETGETVKCTVSIGVAELQPDEDIASLIRRADEACYGAKRAGKNRAQLAATR